MTVTMIAATIISLGVTSVDRWALGPFYFGMPLEVFQKIVPKSPDDIGCLVITVGEGETSFPGLDPRMGYEFIFDPIAEEKPLSEIGLVVRAGTEAERLLSMAYGTPVTSNGQAKWEGASVEAVIIRTHSDERAIIFRKKGFVCKNPEGEPW